VAGDNGAMIAAAGRGLVLGEEQINVHCVACGGGYAWAGCATSPSRSVRIDPNTLTTREVRHPVGSALHDFGFDGAHLWVAHASGHLSRLHPETLQMDDLAIPLASGQRPFAYCVEVAAGFVWVGYYTDPATVLRIDPACPDRRCELVIPEAPMWALRDLVWDGRRLWASVYDVPGRLIAIEPELDGYHVVDLGEDNMLPTSLAFDGRRVWVGCDSRPARLVAVDPVTHELEIHVLHESSSCARGLTVAAGALWAGLYTDPGQIMRLDPQSGESEVRGLPQGYANVRGLAAGDGLLWACLQNTRYQPSAVFAIPLTGEDRWWVASG